MSTFMNYRQLSGVQGNAEEKVVGVDGLPVTIATAAAVTFSVRQILSGLILRDPAGDARADLLPTAALIIAALANPEVGAWFEFTIRNTADAAETITVTTATGLTLSGTMTIAQNASRRFRAVVTSSTAVSVYSLNPTH